MENDDRKKYLKRLRIQNGVLLIIIIISVVILAYRLSNYIQDYIFRESKYYRKFSHSYFSSELEAFNSQFTIYGGNQTGAKLKSMIGTLIANANTYHEYATRIPKVDYRGKDNIIIYSDNRIRSTDYEEKKEKEKNVFEKMFRKYDYKEFDRILEMEKDEEEINNEFIKNNGINSYIEVLADIRSNILINKTTYNVEFTYKWNGAIDTIIIKEL